MRVLQFYLKSKVGSENINKNTYDTGEDEMGRSIPASYHLLNMNLESAYC